MTEPDELSRRRRAGGAAGMSGLAAAGSGAPGGAG